MTTKSTKAAKPNKTKDVAKSKPAKIATKQGGGLITQHTDKGDTNH
jgi:hypothetical protein